MPEVMHALATLNTASKAKMSPIQLQSMVTTDLYNKLSCA